MPDRRQPSISGVDHIAVTVRDIDVSVAFYAALLGSDPVASMADGPFQRRILALPGGVNLGLTQHDRGSGKPFEASTPGLDHLGLGVADRAELQTWVRHLDELGVAHSGIVEAAYGTALSFVDPDGVALDLFVPA